MTPRARRAGPIPESPRVGGVRPSALMYTFGVGSVIDLPNFSVMVAGLDDWPAASRDVIPESRLLAAVRSRLGGQVRTLESAPYQPESDNPLEEWARVGVPVLTFPRWMRCTLSTCNKLAAVDSGEFKFKNNPFKPNEARWVHFHGQREFLAVPARFILACPNGHIDDFPWVAWAHRDKGLCALPMLELLDSGIASRSTDLRVTCQNCGAEQFLGGAFGPNADQAMPLCRGRHPHLHIFESCGQRAIPMLVGASNSWFAWDLSVLSIPESGGPIDNLVEKNWADLEDVVNSEDLSQALKFNKALARQFAEYDHIEIVEAIERKRTPPKADEGLLPPEWRVFNGPEIQHEDLTTRHLAPPMGHETTVAGTVGVDRLREVVALCGFARVDALDPEEHDRDVRLVRLANEPPRWVPASETRGEGILVRFPEPLVQAWEVKAESHPRIVAIAAAHRSWRTRRNLDPDRNIPTARFVLLHTISHLLIHQLAIECGYPTASVRERIYSRRPIDGEPMAGLLLYTAAPDSEGTLGGLVRLAEPDTLGRLLDESLARAALCSTDPFCSEHEPDFEQGSSLHGAACHACLFLPETSCSYANRYLDRGTVVPTLKPAGIAWWSLTHS